MKSHISMVMKKLLFQVIMASYTYYFRTTVRNGYNTVLLDKIYVNLRILTYIKKWDVPCLVINNDIILQSEGGEGVK